MQGSGLVGSVASGILINVISVDNLILFIIFTVVAAMGVSIFLFFRFVPFQKQTKFNHSLTLH
jgi:hypothetical protein